MVFERNNTQYKILQKRGLKNYLQSIDEYKQKEKLLDPDECILNEEKKIMIILEKKNQNRPGSVDEKLETFLFKLFFYKELYPHYKIQYAYVLNNWFRQDKYLPNMRFFIKHNIPVFWGEDDNYFEQLFQWIDTL